MQRTPLYLAAAVSAALSLAPAHAGQIYVPAVRELIEKRTTTSKSYQLADGTYRLEAYLQPIHYRAPDGSLAPIDTTLLPATRSGFALTNQTNTIGTLLPPNAQGWVRVEAAGVAVSFRPVGAAPGILSVGGSQATIAEVGPGVALSYEVQPNRLKEKLLLSTPGPAVFRFDLRLDGLSPVANADGSVTLQDGNGQPRLTLEAPWMRDAAGNESKDISVSLDRESGGYLYSMNADAGWLARAQYPVTIDPSIQATFVSPGAYALHDYPAVWTVATPNIHVGAPAANQSGASRGFLQFNASALPLDAELLDAGLLCYIDPYHLNYNPMTIEARELPQLVTTPTGVIWGTNPLVIGQDLNEFAGGIPKTFTSWGYYATPALDVTAVVQSWADKRFVPGVGGSPVALPLNIVVHDVLDGPNDPGSGNVMYLRADPGSPYPMQLNVSYTTPGWYTFQGNKRRTGHTQYPIPASATRQWSSNLPTASGNLAQSPVFLTPSPVAVTDSSNPDSPYPIIYVAVADDYDTYVYRIVDTGNTCVVGTPYLVSNFRVTGTPMVLPGSPVPVPDADKIILCGNGTRAYTGNAVYLRLDALTSGGTTTWTSVWQTPVPGPGYSTPGSPAYDPAPTKYILHKSNTIRPTVWNTDGEVIASLNFFSFNSSQGYMIALSLGTGRAVWGETSMSGLWWWYNGSLGGLPNVGAPPCTSSSPSLMGNTAAFMNDTSCYDNARWLQDGTAPWQLALSENYVYSTESLYNGRMYHGESGVAEVVTRNSAGDRPLYVPTPGDVWSTGAVSPDHNTIVYGDVYGNIAGFNTDITGITPTFNQRWTASPIDIGSIYASPIVAGNPGSGQANIWVSGDGQLVYALNAAGGATLAVRGDGVDYLGKPVPLNGPVRASMAAFKGRLYVLSDGTAFTGYPTLYCLGG